MAFALGNRVWETTSTTGTGSLTLDGAKETNFQTFEEGVGANNTTHYFIVWANGWEAGIGTVGATSSGLIARTVIVANSLGTTDPMDLPGGEKDVFCSAIASKLMINDQRQEMAAPIDMNAQPIYIDADGDTWVAATTDDTVDFYVKSSLLLQLRGASLKEVRVRTSDVGVNAGPILALYRALNVSNDDRVGTLEFASRTNDGIDAIYAHIYCLTNGVTAGSHGGDLYFALPISGSLTNMMRITSTAVEVLANGILMGSAKTAFAQPNNVGVELRYDGRSAFTTSNAIPVTINRKTADGTLVELQRDGVAQGSIGVASGVVSYNTFTGAHWSEWDPAFTPMEELGTVVCSTDEMYDEDKPELPRIRVSAFYSDPAVYGVVSGRETDEETGKTRLIVEGLGTGRVKCIGPVHQGDLLTTSHIPGVAVRQMDRVIQSHTLGKVRRSCRKDGIRLVYITLLCG